MDLFLLLNWSLRLLGRQRFKLFTGFDSISVLIKVAQISAHTHDLNGISLLFYGFFLVCFLWRWSLLLGSTSRRYLILCLSLKRSLCIVWFAINNFSLSNKFSISFWIIYHNSGLLIYFSANNAESKIISYFYKTDVSIGYKSFRFLPYLFYFKFSNSY